MSADKVDETKIQNKEAYDGIKEAMLQKGAIPKEIIEKDKAIQEEKEIRKKFQGIIDNVENSIEAIKKNTKILSI